MSETNLTRDMKIYGQRFRGHDSGAPCRILFAVIGPDGAISLTIHTDWYLDSRRTRNIISELSKQPWISDIGLHSKTQRDYAYRTENCDLTNGVCYYDGTSLNDDWREGLIREGTDWLWPKLEQLYRFCFENGPYPDLKTGI